MVDFFRESDIILSVEETTDQAYFCESADWCALVSSASSCEEAAAIALQQQFEKENEGFTVGAAISVLPIKIYPERRSFVLSPAVLADCGMHNYAADMLQKLNENSESDNPSK